MTARIDRNRLFKILALDGQGSDAYLADQVEARIDEWLVESTAPVPGEPVLDLGALERVILDAVPWAPDVMAGDVAAAVERHVAPILAAARQNTAPTTPVELAKDPKIAAAVLRGQALTLTKRTEKVRVAVAQWAIDWMTEAADALDPPEPPEPEPGQRLFKACHPPEDARPGWTWASCLSKGEWAESEARYEATVHPIKVP